MSPPELGHRRRARPLLGTLVEIGATTDGGEDPNAVDPAIEAGFAAIFAVHRALSRFEPDSDLGRLHATPAGTPIRVRATTRRVLRAAQALTTASGGLFDISLGSGAAAWRCREGRLSRDHAELRLDAGGIAKGYAVDCAVAALRRSGCRSGWVNAGGDLRVFGELGLPVLRRDEAQGGVRPWGQIADGALASSSFGPHSRSRLAAGMAATDETITVTVVAGRCLWADALTKIVAATGDADHPLLRRLGARAWLDRSPPLKSAASPWFR